MKKTLHTLAFITLLCNLSFSQITLKATYDNELVFAVEYSDSEKVYSYNRTSRVLNIYDFESSSLLKTITVPSFTTGFSSDPVRISQYAFDSDSGFEYVVYVNDGFIIYNDDNTVLFEGSGSDPIFEIKNNKLYLKSRSFDDQKARFYELSDAVLAVEPVKRDASNSQLSPNPANDFINVSYDVELNSNSEIEILDITGNTLDVIAIDNDSKSTQIDISELSSGVYLYRINSNSTTVGKGKFVVE